MEIYVDGSQTPDKELYVSLVGMKGTEKLFSYVSYLPMSGDNMTAEQVALLMAMELIEEQYPKESVVLFSDQIFYVEVLQSGQLKTKHFGTHEYITYLYEMHQRIKHRVDIRYVKRSKNKADKLFEENQKRCVDTFFPNQLSINHYLVKVIEKSESYKFKKVFNLGMENSPKVISMKKYRLKSGKQCFTKSG